MQEYDPRLLKQVGELVNGELPAYAWPGGYPLVYFTRDGMTICPACANKKTDQSQAAIAADIYWEGPPLACDDCGQEIESAYGDLDEKNA